MKLAIASGKGGTGKTTLAVALATLIPGCRLLDADVEEPNARLFVKGDEIDQREVTMPIPVVDPAACTACGACVRFCRFNALALAGGKILVFEELCHGCGGCSLVCPTRAIHEKPLPIGALSTIQNDTWSLVEGRLNVGRMSAPLVIRRLLAQANKTGETIIDCPPGTSCNMVTAVRDADYTILVTEATAFGLQDLSLAVNTMRKLKKRFGVIINRADLGDDRVRRYCADESVKIHLEIPFSRDIAQAIANGKTMLDGDPGLSESLSQILAELGMGGIA